MHVGFKLEYILGFGVLSVWLWNCWFSSSCCMLEGIGREWFPFEKSVWCLFCCVFSLSCVTSEAWQWELEVWACVFLCSWFFAGVLRGGSLFCFKYMLWRIQIHTELEEVSKYSGSFYGWRARCIFQEVNWSAVKYPAGLNGRACRSSANGGAGRDCHWQTKTPPFLWASCSGAGHLGRHWLQGLRWSL